MQRVGTRQRSARFVNVQQGFGALTLSQLPHHPHHHDRYTQTCLFQYVRLAQFHPILSRHNHPAFFTVIVVFAIIVVRSYIIISLRKNLTSFPVVGHICVVNCTLRFQLPVHN